MSQMRDPNQVITIRADGSVDVGTVNNEPTMTQEQFADEADINYIMRKYDQTGVLPLRDRPLQYADLTSISDFQGMLDQVMAAEQAFMSLPAKVRQRFNNSPHELIQFLEDDKNYDEGVKLGLVNEKQVPPVPAIKRDLDANEAMTQAQTKTTETKKQKSPTE